MIGLSIARELSHRLPKTSLRQSILVIDRHKQAGAETSSRNSNVIHAGIYYPNDSLKTFHCIRGRKLLYQLASEVNSTTVNARIRFNKCGKWIIAQTDEEVNYLGRLAKKAQALEIDLQFVDDKRLSKEDVLLKCKTVVESTESGIIDGDALMKYLEVRLLTSEVYNDS